MFGGRYVPAGETFGVEEFRLIYPDVYGPATPDGDRKMIDASALQFYLVSLDDELECIAGLGVGYGSYIPLQGQDLRRVARRYDVDPPPRERSC